MNAATLVAAALVAAAVGPETEPQEKAQQGSQAQPPIEATVLFDDDSAFSGPITAEDDSGLTISIDEYDEPASVDIEVLSSLVLKPSDPSETWPLEAPTGMDVLTLDRRQVVRGRAVDVSAAEVAFVSERFGRLTIPAAECGDLVPPTVADSGPGVSPLWNPWMGAATRGDSLRVVDDALRLNGRGAVAARDCMASGGTIELGLKWRGKPEFKVHVGGDHRDDPSTGVVIQPWDDSLVLFTWNGETLDPVPTGIVMKDDSSFVLRVDVDAEFVTLTSVEYPDGTVLSVDRRVRRAESGAGGVVAIEALGRPMSIESARITSGIPLDDGRVRVARPVLSTEILEFDGAGRQFRIEAGVADFDDSLGIRLAWGTARRELTAVDPFTGHFRVTCRDGEAIETAALRFADGALRIVPRWGTAEVAIPLGDLWHVRRTVARKGAASGGERAELSVQGRAKVGVRLSGIEIGEGGMRPTLRVYGFKNTVRLDDGVPFSLERSTAAAFHAARRDFPHVLVLRDGQMFPARLASLADDVLRIETPFAEGTSELSVHDVEAVLVESSRAMRQFDKLKEKAKEPDRGRGVRVFRTGAQPQRDPTEIDQERLQRALLVPRNQTEDPGEHLLIAKNGDLLRGNVVAIDEDGAVTVRGGSGPAFQFPLERLASWVHVAPGVDPPPAETDDTWQVTLGSSNLIRGQATLRGRPTSVENGRVSFEHAALGSISFVMEDVKRIDHVQRATRRRFVFDRWETKPMPEPVITDDSGESGG